MNQKLVKKECGGEMEDRLSELPYEILLHILFFLDTKTAVQTSVLCKRLRYLWTGITTLHFNPSTFSNYFSFKKFVNHVLFHRDESKNLHQLKIYSCMDGSITKVVIDYLVLCGRGIQDLVVHSVYLEPISPFWTHLFTWESLKTLRLEHLAIPINVHFDFVSLTTLHLEFCWLRCHGDDCSSSKGYFKISAPHLTDLIIKGLGFEEHEIPDFKMIIYSPNLLSFHFGGKQLFDFSFSTLLLLQNVNVYIDDDLNEIEYKYLMNMLQQLCNAKFVTLSDRTILVLSSIEPDVLQSYPSPFFGADEIKIKVLSKSSEAPTQCFTIPIHVLTYLLSGAKSFTFQHI